MEIFFSKKIGSHQNEIDDDLRLKQEKASREKNDAEFFETVRKAMSTFIFDSNVMFLGCVSECLGAYNITVWAIVSALSVVRPAKCLLWACLAICVYVLRVLTAVPEGKTPQPQR